jgi:pimeloyl-ACP methyl ester carboxylesterase
MRFVAHSLARVEAGVGGRPLLLVHGFTAAKEDFADHLEPLAAAGWHAVALDLPGHGASQLEDFAYGFDTFAAAVLAVADELGWDRFALLGHSMGGIVAQHLALAAPQRLTALVLLDTSPGRIAVDAELVEQACAVVAEAGMAGLLAVTKVTGSPMDTEVGRRLREERPGWEAFQDAKLLQVAPAMYLAMARAITSAASRVDQLATLEVPTLVLVGEHDRLLREPSEALAAAIPGAVLVVLPGAGHSPQVETPEVWRETVVGFLA